MNIPLITSLMTLALIGIVAGSGKLAYFSNTEISENNLLRAGSLNTKIDLIKPYNTDKDTDKDVKKEESTAL